jgi:hypothetical protein
MTDKQPDLRDKVRLAELSNIAKKLKLGKTLNAREAGLIDAESEQRNTGEVRWAANLKQASILLGITVSRLKRHRDKGSKAFVHGRVNIALCKSEMGDLPAVSSDPADLEEKEILERRKIRAQWRKEEYKLEVEQRRHIPINEVHADMIRIGNATRAECLRLLADAPGWVGLDESAISQRVTDWMTTLCTTLSDDMSKLYK